MNKNCRHLPQCDGRPAAYHGTPLATAGSAEEFADRLLRTAGSSRKTVSCFSE
jgi:hypothetical protein